MQEKKEVSFVVEIGAFYVEFFAKDEYTPPHGWETTTDDTTNEEGYYNTGGLWWVGKKLQDFDGVYELPKAVSSALTQLGYDVSECI